MNYELKIYKRTKEFRAPKELEKVHPLGKSPVIEIIREGKEPLLLAETGHIIQYVVENYDTTNILKPSTPEEKELVDYYLHFTEASLQGFLVALLVGQIAQTKAPWGTGFLVKLVTSGINSQYFQPELLKSLKFLESQLAKKSTNQYFVGNKLTGADVILSFPIIDNLFSNPARASTISGGEVNLVRDFPNLHAWTENVLKLPSYVKTNEIIDKKLGSKL